MKCKKTYKTTLELNKKEVTAIKKLIGPTSHSERTTTGMMTNEQSKIVERLYEILTEILT